MEGQVAVFLGSAAGLDTVAAWRHEPDSMYAFLGNSVASAGDVNGDGYDDVIAGATNESDLNPQEGAAYVWLGSAAGLSDSPDWSVYGGSSGVGMGFSVASAGDVNGDGYDDVVVGAPWDTNGETSEGRAFLYLGSAAGLDTVAAWSAESNQVNAGLGYSVASAGDVDGDGLDDVIVGTPFYITQQGIAGRTSLFRGTVAGLDPAAAWTLDGNSVDEFFGWSVASAGDVDGDGYDDVLVSAEISDVAFENGGEVSLFHGSAAGLGAVADWIAYGGMAYANFGSAVAAAGDVDADGYSDVVIGAAGVSSPEVSEGNAMVYLGSAAGLAPAPVWVFDDADSGHASFGAAVAGAGDTNGDGYADVLVGGAAWSDEESQEGGAWSYLGGADVDLDGVPNGLDRCQGFDDALDADGDGAPDGCDRCPGADDGVDADGDTFPDACDACAGFDDAADADFDGVADGCDACLGFDDASDGDLDAVPDACDVCDGADDAADADADLVPDGCDVCTGSDDALDNDLDAVPDGCDACAGFDDALDADADYTADGCDVCAGSDDRADADGDAVPDGCDACPGADDAVDSDGDGVADGCDDCIATAEACDAVDNDCDGLVDEGCPAPDTDPPAGDGPTGEDVPAEAEGCGCAHGGSAGSVAGFLAMVAVLGRQRATRPHDKVAGTPPR
jgi:hypothetical protein